MENCPAEKKLKEMQVILSALHSNVDLASLLASAITPVSVCTGCAEWNFNRFYETHILINKEKLLSAGHWSTIKMISLIFRRVCHFIDFEIT